MFDSTKFMQFSNDRPCPLCNCTENVILSNHMQFNLNCTTVICNGCGFCFVSPTPTKEAYSKFYREAYSIYYNKIHPEASGVQPLRENENEKSRINLIEKHKKLKGAKVLEIGPGRGRFLQLVARRGATVSAIEPSKEFRKSLEQSEIHVIGEFLEDTVTDKKFDIIMLFQVLEHFHDPVNALGHIKKLLSPHGIVVLDVPNIWKPFRSLDGYFLRYVHLSYFSPQTLKRLFLSQNFEEMHLEDGEAYGAVVSPIFAIFRYNQTGALGLECCRDEHQMLIKHLKRYRIFYPYRYFPVYLFSYIMKLPRRMLSKSEVGRLYRHLKYAFREKDPD